MSKCAYCKKERPEEELEQLRFPDEKICLDCDVNYVERYQRRKGIIIE